MSEEHEKKAGKVAAPGLDEEIVAAKEGPTGTRREIIKAGIAAVPILLTLKSKPAWAKEDKYTHSDKMSATHFSHHPDDAK